MMLILLTQAVINRSVQDSLIYVFEVLPVSLEEKK